MIYILSARRTGRREELKSARAREIHRAGGVTVAKGWRAEKELHTHTHTAPTTMTGRSSPLAAVCATTWIDEVCPVCVRGIMSRASFPSPYGSFSVAIRSQPARRRRRRRRRRWLYIFCNCLSVRARMPPQQYNIIYDHYIVRAYSRGDSTSASPSVHVSDLLQHPYYYYYYTRPSRRFVDGHLSSSNATAAALTTP